MLSKHSKLCFKKIKNLIGILWNLLEKKQSLLQQTQKKLSDGTAINPINVAIESKNQGGFQTKILIRDHEIISDQPFGFNGQNKGPKPSELVLAALAACQETTYRIFAEDMGIQIGEISVQLKVRVPTHIQA